MCARIPGSLSRGQLFYGPGHATLGHFSRISSFSSKQPQWFSGDALVDDVFNLSKCSVPSLHGAYANNLHRPLTSSPGRPSVPASKLRAGFVRNTAAWIVPASNRKVDTSLQNHIRSPSANLTWLEEPPSWRMSVAVSPKLRSRETPT